MYGLERKQPVRVYIIAFQYLQGLFVQGDSDCLCLTLFRFLWHVFQKAVLDIFPCQPVKVSDATADIAVEHEYIPDDRQFRIVTQIRIVQDIPFLRSKVERVPVCRFLAAVECIHLVVGIFHLLAPVQECTEEIHNVDDGRVGERLGFVVDKHTGNIELRMLLTQQVLIRDIIPETVHLFQCDSLHKEREVTITQYFPLVVVIAGHLALETYDMLFGSISPFVLLQIFMNTIEQSWMVAFEGACRIQHIFDNLLQPFAVRLVRKGLLHFLDDGGNLLGQAFLVGGRYGCRAFIT